MDLWQRTLHDVLKYEVVDESPLQIDVVMVPVLPTARYLRWEMGNDQYTCPKCACPAIRSKECKILGSGILYDPRLFAFRCLSGHIYLVRFNYSSRYGCHLPEKHAWMAQES